MTILYDQIANFYDYRLSPDAAVSHGAGDGVFIMYKIVSINNEGSDAVDFAFDPHKLQAGLSTEHADTPLSHPLAVVTVPKGKTLAPASGVGCVVMRVSGDPKHLVSATVDLLYQGGGNADQPISMKRIDSDDSTALVGNALPSTLNNLCAGIL